MPVITWDPNRTRLAGLHGWRVVLPRGPLVSAFEITVASAVAALSAIEALTAADVGEKWHQAVSGHSDGKTGVGAQ